MFLSAYQVCRFLQQFNVVNTTHYSSSLEQEKPVKIYLPPDYYNNPDEHYPVIYFLHGATGDQNSYPGMISWTQSLINNGTIHPVIVVFANGACPPYWGSMYANSAFYGNYEDYIVYDLVEFIDTTFRTLAERNFRCITGHSMGGGGSAKLAIKHPDIYRGFASHAGVMNFDTTLSIWHPLILQENGGVPPYNYTWGAGTYTNFVFSGAGAWSPNMNNPPTYVDYMLGPDGNVVDSTFAKWKLHDNCCLVKQISLSDNLGFFFSCGTEDDHQLYPTNELFRDTLDMLGLDYVFLTTSGDHSLSGDMIQAGMKFLDSLMYFGVGTEEKWNIVARSSLHFTVSPNPISDFASINLDLQNSDHLNIQIFNAMGAKVAELYHGQLPAGQQRFAWHAGDLAKGLYFCRVQAGNETRMHKIIKN
jgi:S-formylglutathione hydrolase FrmB